uniref:Uncharacterized protein n=1 Tax=Physcomitrium patens TaxID=3218 RepID=A0A2K1K9Y6_PHYPA|nr:hypothetical protein PHYPA_009782 [Physcomitrium patens]
MLVEISGPATGVQPFVGRELGGKGTDWQSRFLWRVHALQVSLNSRVICTRAGLTGLLQQRPFGRARELILSALG